jgi:hypothetical protein
LVPACCIRCHSPDLQRPCAEHAGALVLRQVSGCNPLPPQLPLAAALALAAEFMIENIRMLSLTILLGVRIYFLAFGLPI